MFILYRKSSVLSSSREDKSFLVEENGRALPQINRVTIHNMAQRARLRKICLQSAERAFVDFDTFCMILFADDTIALIKERTLMCTANENRAAIVDQAMHQYMQILKMTLFLLHTRIGKEQEKYCWKAPNAVVMRTKRNIKLSYILNQYYLTRFVLFEQKLLSFKYLFSY